MAESGCAHKFSDCSSHTLTWATRRAAQFECAASGSRQSYRWSECCYWPEPNWKRGKRKSKTRFQDVQLRPNLSAAVPIRVALGVERAHVVDLLEVDVREDQFVVAGVDDGRSVRASEHIGCGERAEGAQNGWLSAESDLLTFT